MFFLPPGLVLVNDTEVFSPLLDPSVGRIPVLWAAPSAVTGWDLGNAGAGGCTGCSGLRVPLLYLHCSSGLAVCTSLPKPRARDNTEQKKAFMSLKA